MKKAERLAAKETDGGDQLELKDINGENERSCCHVTGGFIYIFLLFRAFILIFSQITLK